MNKKEKFLILVQTMCIIKDIKDDRRCAGVVLDDAFTIKEKDIPDDTYIAALSYVDYQYNCYEEKPKWLK